MKTITRIYYSLKSLVLTTTQYTSSIIYFQFKAFLNGKRVTAKRGQSKQQQHSSRSSSKAQNQMGGVHHMNHETFLLCVERYELSLRISLSWLHYQRTSDYITPGKNNSLRKSNAHTNRLRHENGCIKLPSQLQRE